MNPGSVTADPDFRRTIMNRNGTVAVLWAALAPLLVCPVWAQDEAGSAADNGGIGSAIASGKAGVTLRYRYEFVDQESFDDNANASTLLIRLQYETAAWNGWSGFIQFDEILEVLVNDFNSGAGTSSPRRDRYPVVADPNGSDMNQLYLQYAPNDDWRTRLGRTLINLDDQRFVGGVGWRQNEQTYDGGSLQFKGLKTQPCSTVTWRTLIGYSAAPCLPATTRVRLIC